MAFRGTIFIAVYSAFRETRIILAFVTYRGGCIYSHFIEHMRILLRVIFGICNIKTPPMQLTPALPKDVRQKD